MPVGDYNIEDKDVVKDFTKFIKPIWDQMIPETTRDVISFHTNKFLKVQKKKRVGPYHRTETRFYYECLVQVDRQPFLNAGWDGSEVVDEDLINKAFPYAFWEAIREDMLELTNNIGLEISRFDMVGDLKGVVKENE